MWQGFDGHVYTRDEFAQHVKGLTIGSWVKFIVLHNTGNPDLKLWMGYSEAQRMHNLQRYYEIQQHWEHGPHLFIGPTHICGFSDLHVRGTHCSCWNGCSLGIEMAGNYEVGGDDFDTGYGAQVKDNAVFAMAVLHRHLGIRPDKFRLGVSGLHFHRDCPADHHACPGSDAINRNDLIRRVLAEMARQSEGGLAPAGHQSEVKLAHDMRWFQVALNRLVPAVQPLKEDDIFGPLTSGRLKTFQDRQKIPVTGLADLVTEKAIEVALALQTVSYQSYNPPGAAVVTE